MSARNEHDSRLFACLKPLRAASRCELSVAAHFYTTQSVSLVVSCGTVLNIYDVIRSKDSLQLRQIDTYSLSGVVTSLIVLKGFGADGRDAIALGLSSLKVVHLMFDPTKLQIHAFKLDNFEGAADMACVTPQVRHLCVADPTSRCVALQTSGTIITVAPTLTADNSREVAHGLSTNTNFAKQLNLNVKADGPKEAETIGETSSWQAFEMDLRTLGIKGVLKDMVFLEGYLEPTLALLIETPQTYVGRVASISFTAICYGVALDRNRGQGAIVWSCNVLPHDCHSLFSAVLPRRGVVVLADNSITYLDQQLIDAVALNAFADMKIDNARDAPGYGRSHAGAVRAHEPLLGITAPFGSSMRFLSPDHAALLLPSGQLFLLQLAAVPFSYSEYKLGQSCGVAWGEGKVLLHLEAVAALPSGGHLECVPFDFDEMPEKLGTLGVASALFASLTSADAQLLLVDLLPEMDDLAESEHKIDRVQLDIAVEETKRRRICISDEEEFLYGRAIEVDASRRLTDGNDEATKVSSRCRIRVLDTILNLGPASCISCGMQHGASKDAPATEFVFGTGREDTGCLVQAKMAFRPVIGAATQVSAGGTTMGSRSDGIDTVYMAGAVGSVSMVAGSDRVAPSGTNETIGCALVNTTKGCRVFDVVTQSIAQANAGLGHATALVLAEKVEEPIETSDRKGFQRHCVTLKAGSVARRQYFVQVYAEFAKSNAAGVIGDLGAPETKSTDPANTERKNEENMINYTSQSPKVFIRLIHSKSQDIVTERLLEFGLGSSISVKSVDIEDSYISFLLSDGRLLLGIVAEDGTLAIEEKQITDPSALGRDGMSQENTVSADELASIDLIAVTLFSAPENLFSDVSAKTSLRITNTEDDRIHVEQMNGESENHADELDEMQIVDEGSLKEDEDSLLEKGLSLGLRMGLGRDSFAEREREESRDGQLPVGTDTAVSLAEKEEETQLYGCPLDQMHRREHGQREDAAGWNEFSLSDDLPAIFCAAVSREGCFLVLSVPDMTRIFATSNTFGLGLAIYKDIGVATDVDTANDSEEAGASSLQVQSTAHDGDSKECDVSEICVAPVGPTSTPLLWCWTIVVRTRNDAVQLYRIRKLCSGGKGFGFLTALHRIPDAFITQSYGNLRKMQETSRGTIGEQASSRTLAQKFEMPKLTAFRFCEGLAGIFMNTQRPAMVLGERGLACLLPAAAPPTRTPFSMVGFHPINLGLGFLLTLREGDAMQTLSQTPSQLAQRRILLATCSGLGAGICLGAACPESGVALVRRLPLRALSSNVDDDSNTTHNLGRGWTPRHICYLGQGEGVALEAELSEPTYMVTVSRMVRLGFKEARTALAEAATSIRQIIEIVEQEAEEQAKEQMGMGSTTTASQLGGTADLRHVEHKNFGEPNLEIGRPPPLAVERYECWLMQPNRGLGTGLGAGSAINVAPIYRMALSKDEKALCAVSVRLRSHAVRRAGDLGVRKLYALVGTGRTSSAGEDALGGGRVLLFEVVSSRGTDGAHKSGMLSLKLVCAQSIIDGGVSAVSAAAQCGEYVVLCHGRRITVHRWLGKSFEQVAFHESDFLAVSLSVIPQERDCTIPSHIPRSAHRPRCRVFSAYIQVCDVYRGERLLRFDEHSAFNGSRKLRFLAKERHYNFRGDCLTGGFWFSSPGLDLCACDTLGNLRLLQYDPKGLESQNRSFFGT